jgi:DNA polymerase-3 subunit delta
MPLRAEQLAGHLAKACRPLYTVVGDDPLLQQEAADAIRAAARAAGCSEREVHTVAGAHFDWSGLLGAARGMSLFAESKLVEIRIPSGKPGKDGADALQRFAEDLPEGVVTIVLLPRLDAAQLKSGWFGALDAAGVVVRVEPVERDALPAWIAQRLARQGQRVAEGEDGRRALAFFADRVEGNLLAAQQEIAKVGLLYPEGELTADQIEAAVLDVARYDLRQLGAAVLAGQVGRALRILDGLASEGESAPGVLWRLADDLRALARVHAALDAGQPLPLALNEARLWGPGARAVEQAAPRFDSPSLRRLLAAASVADGVTKGLRRPDWPDDPWDALRRLVLMILETTSSRSRAAYRPQGQ